MELLSKIAAVFVTLLLYCVIAILQMPKTVHAAADVAVTTGHAGGLPAADSVTLRQRYTLCSP